MHQSFPSSNLIPSATSWGSCRSSFDPSDLSRDNGVYLMPNNVAETTPGWCDHAAPLLTAARLYLNLAPAAPMNWGQSNPNLNDYHSDPMEISNTFWLPDMPGWWGYQEEMHSKYANHSNVVRDRFSIIQHGVGVKASFSLGGDVISWMQSKTTGETFRETVIVRQFAPANNGILAGSVPDFDSTHTENDSEMKKEVEECKLPRMAQVHHFWETWQGSQNLRATQKESRAQNKQMTAVGYMSDTEAIVNALWSQFHHDGASPFKLSERSSLPPPLSANDLPGGRTQIFNIRWIWRIICHPFEIDEDSTPECISDTAVRLNLNGDINIPNGSEADCAADVESDIEQGNSIEDLECPEQRDVSTAPSVSGLIQPTRKPKRQANRVLMTVHAIETRRSKGVKKM